MKSSHSDSKGRKKRQDCEVEMKGGGREGRRNRGRKEELWERDEEIRYPGKGKVGRREENRQRQTKRETETKG